MEKKIYRLSNATLLLGWITIVTGLFFLPSRHCYKNTVYVLFIFPSLFLAYHFVYKERKRINIPFVFFICVLLWLVISSLWASETDLTRAIRRAIVIGITPISFYYLLKDKKLFYWTTVISVTAVSAFLTYWEAHTVLLHQSLFNFFRLHFLLHVKPMFNILMFSHVLGFLTAIMIAIAMSATGYIRIISLFNIIILSSIIFFLGERTPIISLLFVCIVLLPLNLIHLKSKLFWLSLAIIIIIIIFNHQHITAMILQRKFIRISIWTEAIQLSLKKIFFGHGWDTPILIHTVYKNIPVTFHDAHNLFIQMLFYGGLVGLTLIAGLYTSCLLFALRHKMMFGIVLTAFGFAAVQTDGMGLLSKPKEEWFNVWLPVAIVIAQSLLVTNTKKGTGQY